MPGAAARSSPASCARSGSTTEIENLEWAQWLEKVFKGKDFDLTIVSHTEPMDFDIYANPTITFGYDNPAYQALMKTLTATTDPAQADRS